MNVIDRVIPFMGSQDPPDYTAPDGGEFVQKTVKTGGSPLVDVYHGVMRLYLDSTLEDQLACLFQRDMLGYDIDLVQQVDFYAKLSTASLPAAVSLAFGLISAQNNDIDTIAAAALFRCIGNNNVVCETDDGTNDNDDVASGLTLGTSLKRFTIDFASGLRTVEPGPSVGGKANVLFSMDDARGNLRPVARLTTFDMANYSSGLQLFAQIQKGASSSVIAADVTAALYIERIRVRYKTGA